MEREKKRVVSEERRGWPVIVATRKAPRSITGGGRWPVIVAAPKAPPSIAGGEASGNLLPKAFGPARAEEIDHGPCRADRNLERVPEASPPAIDLGAFGAATHHACPDCRISERMALIYSWRYAWIQTMM